MRSCFQGSARVEIGEKDETDRRKGSGLREPVVAFSLLLTARNVGSPKLDVMYKDRAPYDGHKPALKLN